MTTLVQLALAFASIIVIGTLAAWLHDAIEALAARRPATRRPATRRPALRGRGFGTAGAPTEAHRGIARPIARATHGPTARIAPNPVRSPRVVFASPAMKGQAPRRAAASSRTPAPHGPMRVVVRRLGSHAVDA